jgi:trans-aconitate 2-methyltransferase
MTQKEHYTFGDTELAARRLQLLARVFEPSSARLLGCLTHADGAVAIDLGCGPGHTTRLLAQHTRAAKVIGLDQSPKLVEAASRRYADARLSFAECDVTSPPFPAPPAAILCARFLLTHLRDPERAVRAWAGAALDGARLVLEETAFMIAQEATFFRYYALVERMQAHYGQRTYVGRELSALAQRAAPEWVVEASQIVPSLLLATEMARLHSLNLQTWSQDPFALANYDARELVDLGARFDRIASGTLDTPPISLGMGQVVLRRS